MSDRMALKIAIELMYVPSQVRLVGSEPLPDGVLIAAAHCGRRRGGGASSRSADGPVAEDPQTSRHVFHRTNSVRARCRQLSGAGSRFASERRRAQAQPRAFVAVVASRSRPPRGAYDLHPTSDSSLEQCENTGAAFRVRRSVAVCQCHEQIPPEKGQQDGRRPRQWKVVRWHSAAAEGKCQVRTGDLSGRQIGISPARALSPL